MLTSGEINGASMRGYKDLCKTLSWSTPFSNAAFENPKNSFILAGQQGAYETIDGTLSSSVWGRATSLGTGSNFGIFWQPTEGVEKPLPIVQKGVDIHQCITNLNSLLPPETCKRATIHKRVTKPQRYRPHRHTESFPHVTDDHRRLQHLSTVNKHVEGSVPCAPSKVPNEPATAGTKGILGDGRSPPNMAGTKGVLGDKTVKPSPPKMAGTKGILGDGRNAKLSLPKVARVKDILGDGKSIKNSDKGIKHSHRGLRRSNRRIEKAAKFDQDSRGRDIAQKVRIEGNPGEGMSSVCMDPGSGDGIKRIIQRRKMRLMRPSSDDFDEAGNHFERGSPIKLPDSVGEVVGSPRADGHEDSSSFHTPNESLDQTDSDNSSPCSKIRRDLDPPLLTLDFHASEGDQMSGIGQPPVQTPIDEVTRAESSAITQPSGRVDPPAFPNAVGSGSVSTVAGRSRNQAPRHPLNYTTRTERSIAPEDALERHKEEQKDDWERLLQFSRAVQYILHNKYEAGDRLKYEDQRWIVEKLLRYHPNYAQKVGCGVKCIKVDNHEDHHHTRCFFVVRRDGTVCDFSFRKCIKGYANAKSPALAMQYDHEVLFKHERENCSDVDMPYSPDLCLSPDVNEQLATLNI